MTAPIPKGYRPLSASPGQVQSLTDWFGILSDTLPHCYTHQSGTVNLRDDLLPSADYPLMDMVLDSIDDLLTELIKTHIPELAAKLYLAITEEWYLEILYSASIHAPHKHKVLWKPSEGCLCVLN